MDDFFKAKKIIRLFKTQKNFAKRRSKSNRIDATMPWDCNKLIIDTDLQENSIKKNLKWFYKNNNNLNNKQKNTNKKRYKNSTLSTKWK